MSEAVQVLNAVEVYGAGDSPSRSYAYHLRDVIEAGLVDVPDAIVSIHADVFVPGAKYGQIDLVVHALFPTPLVRTVQVEPDRPAVPVTFRSLLAAVEAKEHSNLGAGDAGNLEITPNGVLVRYFDKASGKVTWKSATEQSLGQALALKSSLGRRFPWKRWVCGLLYFPNLQKAALPPGADLCLAYDSTFEDFLGKAALAAKIDASGAGAVPEVNCLSVTDPFSLQARYRELLSHFGQVKLRRQQASAIEEVSVAGRPLRLRVPMGEHTRKLPGFRVLIASTAILLTVAAVTVIIGLQALRRERAAQVGAASPVHTQLCFIKGGKENCSILRVSRRGETVVLRIAASGRQIASARLLTASGNSVVLVPKHDASSQEDVLSYSVPRKAAAGDYSFIVDLQVSGSEVGETIRENFAVVR